jgi:AraC-like DNA-binding protein
MGPYRHGEPDQDLWCYRYATLAIETYTGEPMRELRFDPFIKGYFDSLLPSFTHPAPLSPSMSGFKRDFQKVFKVPPSQWLLRKRLAEAYYQIREKGCKPVDGIRPYLLRRCKTERPPKDRRPLLIGQRGQLSIKALRPTIYGSFFVAIAQVADGCRIIRGIGCSFGYPGVVHPGLSS